MRASLVVLLVAAAASLTGVDASAQLLPTDTTRPPTTTTTTTTTTIAFRPSEPTTTTTTTTAPPEPERQPAAEEPPSAQRGPRPPAPDADPSTIDPVAGGPPAPARADGPAAAPGPPGSPGAAAPAAGTTAASGPAAVAGPNAIPPEAQALINSVRRTGANSTKKLLEALRPLENLGLTRAEIIDAGFGRFPVAGPTTFTDDWLFPRFVPSFHLHEGTDLFAACGTPVRSPATGVLKLTQGGSGGLATYVYEPNGTYYYMAHHQAFVAGQRSGQTVEVGQVIGSVGDSGNAKGGPCHVHFEYHPAPSRVVSSGKGANKTTTVVTRPVPAGTRLAPVNPKPFLDAWLREALAGVPAVIAAFEARPRALVSTGLTRRIGDGQGSLSGPVAPPRSQLLWATSASPLGGAVRLAEAEAMVLATELDWAAVARRQQAALEAEERARALADALVAPLTPPQLRAARAPHDD